MVTMKNTFKTRAFSLLLCALLLVGILPLNALLAMAADGAEVGTVAGLTGGKVNDDDPNAVTVAFGEDAALTWSPAQPQIGRAQPGWWVGVKVTAPAALTNKEAFVGEDGTEVTYQSKNGDSWSAAKSFWSSKDSNDEDKVHFITLWGLVNEQFLNEAILRGANVSYQWRFDWDKNGDPETGDGYEQTVTAVINPKKVKLAKGQDTVYPNAAALGKVSLVEGDFGKGLAVTTVENNPHVAMVTCSEPITLHHVAKDEGGKARPADGWWIGFQMTAPSGDVSNATFQSKTGADGEWVGKNSFKDYKDSDDQANEQYITLWSLVTVEKLQALKEDENLEYGYRFDWDGDDVYEQAVQVSVDPAKMKLIDQTDRQVYPALGKVESLCGGEVTDDKAVFVVTNENTPITVTAAEKTENGEPPQNGWWAGVKVTRPDWVGDNDVEKIRFQVMVNGQFPQDEADLGNSFMESADDDAKTYITLWGLLGDNETTIRNEKTKTFGWRFDWDGDGDYEQTIELRVNTADTDKLRLTTINQSKFGFEQPTPFIQGTSEQNGKKRVYTNKAIGDGTITYSITDANGEATDKAEINEQTGEVTFEMDAEGVFTVTATKAADGIYKEQQVSYTLYALKDQYYVTYGKNGYTFTNPIQEYLASFEGDITYSIEAQNPTNGSGNVAILQLDSNGEVTGNLHIQNNGTVTIGVSWNGLKFTYTLTVAPFTLYVKPIYGDAMQVLDEQPIHDEAGLTEYYGITEQVLRLECPEDADPNAEKMKVSVSENDIGARVEGQTIIFENSEAKEGTITVTVERTGDSRYGDFSLTYTLKVEYDTFSVSVGDKWLKGEKKNTGSDWFTDDVDIADPDKEFSISTTNELPNQDNSNWSTSITIDSKKEEGIRTHQFALRDKTTGHISPLMKCTVKIDITAPDPANITISYSESFINRVIRGVTFGIYKPELDSDSDVMVTVTATDNLALKGIQYTAAEGKTGWLDKEDVKFSKNITDMSKVVDTTDDGNVAKGSFTFTIPPADFCGLIEVVAYDEAGNRSDKGKTVNEQGFEKVIVDSIAPQITVSYEPGNGANVHYLDGNQHDVTEFAQAEQAVFNKTVTATITVTESNFFEGADEGKVHELGILLEQTYDKTDENGNPIKTITEYLPKGSQPLFERTTQTNVTWETKDITWETNGNKHTFEITYDQDADYKLTVQYADFSGNNANTTGNDGNVNGANAPYTSKTVTVDTTAPVVRVTYDNTDRKALDGSREYFTANRTATITVEEHNFRAADFKGVVTALYSDGANVPVEDYADRLAKAENWEQDEHNSNIHRIRLAYTTDANYTFDYTYEDLAHNKADDYDTDEFTVDKVDPSQLKVEYAEDGRQSITDNVLNVLTLGYYYNEKVKVTISAYDDVSGINRFVYSYLKAAGVSGVNAELANQELTGDAIKRNGRTFSAEFTIPKEMLNNENQFDGTVSFTAYERSTRSTAHDETTRVVVDNIAPQGTLTFSTPVEKREGDKYWYYTGNITGTLRIIEANFNKDEVEVVVNGEPLSSSAISWDDKSIDNHVGTFTLSGEGNYNVTVHYTDRSSNQMQTLTSPRLTIDATSPEISISKLTHQHAYNNKDAIGFTLTVTDKNIQNVDAHLEGVMKEDPAAANTELALPATIDFDESVPKPSPDGVDVVQHTYTVKNLEVDGYYTLTCTATDYSNNKMADIQYSDGGSTAKTQTFNFSVNRNGSVFWITTVHTDKYDDSKEPLIDALNDAYANDTVEVTLHEVNVDKVDLKEGDIGYNKEKQTTLTLNNGSTSEIITPGDLRENYNQKSVGNGGWYETTYRLTNDRFKNDGVYSLNVVTYDAAGNSNVNAKSETGVIQFTVDRTKPAISPNVASGDRIRAANKVVEFKIEEMNLDPESVVVTVYKSNGDPAKDPDGNLLENYKPTDDDDHYSFTLGSGYDYTIQIAAKDLAGNVYEPDPEHPLNHITVSTNIFVLWYADKPLFWGSIGGAVLLAGLIILFIILKKRKKKEED